MAHSVEFKSGNECSNSCSLQNLKLRCESECGYDTRDATYLMWKEPESFNTTRKERYVLNDETK